MHVVMFCSGAQRKGSEQGISNSQMLREERPSYLSSVSPCMHACMQLYTRVGLKHILQKDN